MHTRRRCSSPVEVFLACLLPLLMVLQGAEAWGGPMFPPAAPPKFRHEHRCEWSSWTACDASCNGGAQFRDRIPGRRCDWGPISQIRACNLQPCPQNCVLSEWSGWDCGVGGCTGCSAPCGGGYRSRTRTVLSPALFGGTCSDTIQTEACNTQPCPFDCVITSSWSTWKGCSVQCGGGYENRSRTYDLVQVARKGLTQTEASCPNYYEERTCNNLPCPINCIMGYWSNWSGCAYGSTVSVRTRQVEVYPQNGGQSCEDNQVESQSCGSYAPPSYPQYPPAQPPRYPAQPPQYPPAQPPRYPAQPPQYPSQPPQYPPAQPPQYPPAQPPRPYA